MTRFARAKGSKASNERVPDDATPWHVMKQQLVENIDKKQGSQEKDKSEKESLRGKEGLFYYDNTGNVNHDWAEFEMPGSKIIKPKTDGNPHMKAGKKKKNPKEKKVDALVEEATHAKKDSEHVDDTKIKKNSVPKRKSDCIDESTNEIKTKKHKKGKKQLDTEISEQNDNVSQNEGGKNKRKKREANPNENDAGNDEVSPEKTNLHKKRKKGKHSMEKSMAKSTENNTLLSQEENNLVNNNKTNEKDGAILSKRQKRNRNKNDNTKVNTDSKIHRDDGNIANETTEYSKPKFSKNFENKSNDYNNTSNKFSNRNFDTENKPNVKKPKQRDDKEHKRRKPDTYPAKITINGIAMELVRYDGFPVLKADAERLTDLKQQMIIKGIPKNEINMAMTKEKRKAQKALARIRNTTCFHCRKAGHNLSDCPELENEQAGTGICYLCGSTEHTHEQCKGAKAGVFKFATCFICRQQGHITRQCPDNPKGVYPQGGACKICGDVTHLRKDCPDLVKEKEETAITLDTITNDTVEHLEEDRIGVAEKANKSPRKKVVKF